MVYPPPLNPVPASPTERAILHERELRFLCSIFAYPPLCSKRWRRVHIARHDGHAQTLGMYWLFFAAERRAGVARPRREVARVWKWSKLDFISLRQERAIRPLLPERKTQQVREWIFPHQTRAAAPRGLATPACHFAASRRGRFKRIDFKRAQCRWRRPPHITTFGFHALFMTPSFVSSMLVGAEATGEQPMAKKSTRSVRAKSPRGAATVRKATKAKVRTPRGAGAGANQGGAPRGASRLESSTTKKGTGRVSGKRHTQKGRGRISK